MPLLQPALIIGVNLGRNPLKIKALLEMLRVSFSPLYAKGYRAFQEEGLSGMKAWK